ncbi:Vacuolar-sorting protein snf7 [Penicillium oxalicum]|uniref:Vacuolar-sorting protein snf7 n=1 Tax=Penicillium oxalicum TaxID=69781 RepID=UPI0020B80C09|nr:Vacuolar-sorting protein snf7 [Penicillium oxalicum]KAI2788648.1 Vacuolar-sorting protein snf7 [Penicillium oxalicum]
MWSWFGGAAAQKRKDAPKNAILSLRAQLEMLQKREKHLENQIAEQDAAARKHITSNKNGEADGWDNSKKILAAKAALRRKHQHEKNLEQTSAQVVQLEQQIYSIEAANINHETLQAMRTAGDAMKQIHNGMSIEEVDNTMDKLREQHMLSQEIGDAITNMPLGEQMDEGELEAELEGLEQEAMDERMLNTGPTPVGNRLEGLPAAGTAELNKPHAKDEEEDEEAELAKLKAEMAI